MQDGRLMQDGQILAAFLQMTATAYELLIESWGRTAKVCADLVSGRQIVALLDITIWR